MEDGLRNFNHPFQYDLVIFDWNDGTELYDMTYRALELHQ